MYSKAQELSQLPHGQGKLDPLLAEMVAKGLAVWRTIPRVLWMRARSHPLAPNDTVINTQQTDAGMLVVRASIRLKFDSSRDLRRLFGQPLGSNLIAPGDQPLPGPPAEAIRRPFLLPHRR